MKYPALLLVAALWAVTAQEEATLPTVGAAAPTFRLNDQAGQAVKVGPTEDGTWSIVAFYPKAATPG